MSRVGNAGKRGLVGPLLSSRPQISGWPALVCNRCAGYSPGCATRQIRLDSSRGEGWKVAMRGVGEIHVIIDVQTDLL